MTIGKLSSHLQAKQSSDASLFREKLIECKYERREIRWDMREFYHGENRKTGRLIFINIFKQSRGVEGKKE